MTPLQREFLLEVLRSAKAEIEAMEETYDDYVASGHLIDQLDEAIITLAGEDE